MSFRDTLQNLLVLKAKISHKEAKALILSGQVKVNQLVTNTNCKISELDAVWIQSQQIQAAKVFRYYKYYKPVGIECSMRKDDLATLGSTLPLDLKGLQVCGRLDKASEGLLLLTDDGKFLNAITQPGKLHWKTYLIELENEVNTFLIETFEQGMILNGQQTLVANVKVIGTHRLEVQLQEGRNKQIRRMSFAAGNYVTKLQRIAIGEIHLGNLVAHQFAQLEGAELNFVRKFVSI